MKPNAPNPLNQFDRATVNRPPNAGAVMFLCQRDKSVSPLRETPVAAERVLFLLPAPGFRNVTTNAAFLS
jgi:hypothetical protein